MSWVSKFGKPQHESVMDVTENDFPISEVSFMRIGSAHARDSSVGSKILVQLLEKFIEHVNVPFDAERERHELEMVTLPKESD